MGNWQDIHEGLKIVKQISGDGGLGSVYKADYDLFGKMVPVNIEVQQAELFPEEFIMRAAIRVDTVDPAEDFRDRPSVVELTRQSERSGESGPGVRARESFCDVRKAVELDEER